MSTTQSRRTPVEAAASTTVASRTARATAAPRRRKAAENEDTKNDGNDNNNDPSKVKQQPSKRQKRSPSPKKVATTSAKRSTTTQQEDEDEGEEDVIEDVEEKQEAESSDNDAVIESSSNSQKTKLVTRTNQLARSSRKSRVQAKKNDDVYDEEDGNQVDVNSPSHFTQPLSSAILTATSAIPISTFPVTQPPLGFNPYVYQQLIEAQQQRMIAQSMQAQQVANNASGSSALAGGDEKPRFRWSEEAEAFFVEIRLAPKHIEYTRSEKANSLLHPDMKFNTTQRRKDWDEIILELHTVGVLCTKRQAQTKWESLRYTYDLHQRALRNPDATQKMREAAESWHLRDQLELFWGETNELRQSTSKVGSLAGVASASHETSVHVTAAAKSSHSSSQPTAPGPVALASSPLPASAAQDESSPSSSAHVDSPAAAAYSLFSRQPRAGASKRRVTSRSRTHARAEPAEKRDMQLIEKLVEAMTKSQTQLLERMAEMQREHTDRMCEAIRQIQQPRCINCSTMR